MWKICCVVIELCVFDVVGLWKVILVFSVWIEGSGML